MSWITGARAARPVALAVAALALGAAPLLGAPSVAMMAGTGTAPLSGDNGPTTTVSAIAAGTAFVEQGGQVVMEAENRLDSTTRNGKTWSIATTPAGFAGTGLTVVGPNTGNSASSTNTAEERYAIDFSTPGTYQVWLRGTAPGGNDNSVNVGLDGVLSTTADKVNFGTYNSYIWSRATVDGPVATLDVPSAGVHYLSLWMREDGAGVDRILLTTNAGLIPTGVGPAESPRSGGGTDTLAPTVLSHVPASAATEVSTSASVVATFSEPLNPLTVDETSFTLASGSSAVPATVALSSGNTVATLTPKSALSAGTPYTASLAVSIADVAGNPLPATSWGFTTAAASGGTTFQESGGQVVMEAEDYAESISRSGKTWTLSASPPVGFAGTGLMEVGPNTGTSSSTTNTAELRFPVRFTTTGTYRVWLRGNAPNGNDNSAHVGIDGVLPASSTGINVYPYNSYEWDTTTVAGPAATIAVTTPGLHTISLWMREDGMRVDRILLTTNAGFTPTGIGPGGPTTVDLQPSAVSLAPNATQRFTPSVTGPSDKAVAYTVDGIAPATLDTSAARAFASDRLAATYAAVGRTTFPQYTGPSGTWVTTSASVWTSGFFPASLWLAYEASGDPVWLTRARTAQAPIESQKTDTSTHDVGFKMAPFLNDYRLTGDPAAKAVLLTAAASLDTRYSTAVGMVRARNTSDGLFESIIDTLMNLELLYWSSANGGPASHATHATAHALKAITTLQRADGSTYHVAHFNESTGALVSRGTIQGYSDSSTWARGQAWAIDGWTIAFRETGDTRFRDAARGAITYWLANDPADGIPYWDFSRTDLRDTSAAAIAAVGMLRLALLDPPNAAAYREAARHILVSLRSPLYLAQGSSLASALAHGVGNKPSGTGVDVGLVYADYYFAQAMLLMNAVTSGDTAHGTIDATGLYTAPLSAPTPATVTIRATSLGDPTVFDESTVTIGAAAQMAVGP